MSRRRGQRTQAHTETLCSWDGCQRPTRDGALVCDTCLAALGEGLLDLLPRVGDRPTFVTDVRFAHVRYSQLGVVRVEWCPFPRTAETIPGLWAELQASIVGERGIDYATLGGSGGSVWLVDADELVPGERRAVVATGINLAELASDTAELLTRHLRILVRLAQEHHLEHNAPPEWRPRSTELVPAMAEWLAWRVDAMACDPEVAAAAAQVRRMIEWARWCIDRPAGRQHLGPCPVKTCDGDLSAVVGAPFASCYRCGTQVEAQPLRDRLLDELDDRLCTAAEIADLTTYLGLRAGRDRVAALIRQWGKRGVIAERDTDPTTGRPRYRFGDAKTELLAREARSDATSTTTTDRKGA